MSMTCDSVGQAEDWDAMSILVQASSGVSFLSAHVPNKRIRTDLVSDPFFERVPPLTFLAVTAGLIAFSAALFPDGKAAWR